MAEIRLYATLVIALMAVLPAPVGHAGEAPRPVALTPLMVREPELTIAWPTGRKAYALPDLEALGLWRVNTSSFWPTDHGPYEGPLLADVLRHVGLADVSAIRVSARDGFSEVIPRADWERWPIILATRCAGHPMAIRDKGPIRIIYPRDMAEEMKEIVYRLRWVWMVSSIEAESP